MFSPLRDPAAQSSCVARSVPSGPTWNTVAFGPRSRTAARSSGSGSAASVTSAAASSEPAPLEAAISLWTFTLLAERYERGSVLLTSNLPFSKWEGIFKDAMTTAAAIDRLVHHCVILELNIPSYRMEQAKKNRDAGLESAEAK